MIELFDDWCIDADEYSYQLFKNYGSKTYSDGKTRSNRRVVGYYSTVEKALKALARELAREKIKSSVGGLPEAVEAIKESNERVEKLIESEIGKYER